MPRNTSRVALTVAISLTSIVGFATQASAAGPFVCRPGFYQVISGHLKVLNPLTGVYSAIGNDGDDYNAIGYNPRDNYIYGWGSGGAINDQLIRVDSAGTVTPLGNLGLGARNFVSGDFDDNNNLYFRKDNTTLVRINVAANPITATELTLTSGVFGGVDMGWIDGVMHSVDNSTLYRVNLTTLQATSDSIVDANSPSGKEFPTSGTNAYGAIFSNRDDELFASNNSLGRIYKITGYGTANPQATWVTDATVTSNNDGAACKQAVSPFVVPTTIDDSFSTTNDTTLTVQAGSGVLQNDNAATPVVISNTNPSSGTLTLNSDGSFSFQPVAGFVGSTTFTYVAQDQWGRSTSTATVTINVLAATTTATSAPTTSAPAATTTVAPATTTLAPTTTVAANVSAASPKEVETITAMPQTGSTSSSIIQLALGLLLTGFAILFSRRRFSSR